MTAEHSGDEEHPTSGKAEHPEGQEHPASDKKAASGVTLDEVADYVRIYVEENSRNGVFTATDKVAGKQLSLTLDKVHRDRLSRVAPDMHFVCADFKSAEGDTIYDLDLFVQGTNKDNLSVVPGRTTVHKVNGKARYTWILNEKTENWEQQPVSGTAN